MGVPRQALVALGFALIGLAGGTRAWGQTPPAVAFPPFDPAACVARPQHLLILDMKSGWWSGDGGEFHNLLLPRIVKDCPNVDIEYYFLQHLEDGVAAPLPPGLPALQDGIMGLQSFYPLKPGTGNDGLFNPAAFPSRPWSEYSQIWLLSGSNLDPTDVPTSHSFFAGIVQRASTTAATGGQPAPSFFIGSGIGNRDHGNRLLASLQMPELFQSHLAENDTPSVGDGSIVETRSRARLGAELTAHALFEGVETIADTVSISALDYDTDFLPGANNPFQLVARNTKGEPSIGVRETDARRFVIDAGLQRFYSLFRPDEAGTYRYLQNIIKWLAR